ncbi:phytanoyl-CoA dioxygenase family protein [Oscillatoria laete-virens NRMC-F 0139]|nr:phytanoyl-CoA dioxygenase family protein [Oscillatoria laete-virens]MDL5055073.1 phytanoyl-CoA dioxygenase family protein [Oscillatoria laete-virens NRMC-F 0139]
MTTTTLSAQDVTPQDLDDLKKKGFFVKRELFTQTEIDEFLVVADKAAADYESKLDADGFISKKGKISFVNSGLNFDQADQRIIDWSIQPRVSRMARAICGDNAGLFAYQMVYKYPNPDVFPWHQDDNYSRSEKGYVTLWVALSDAMIADGCLWVLPGKSLDTILPAEKIDLGYTCWPLDHPDQGVPVELRKGDGVVFTSKLPHKSGPNVSQNIRKGHIIAFADMDQAFNGQRLKMIPMNL